MCEVDVKWYVPVVDGLRFDVVPDDEVVAGAPLVRVIVQLRLSRSPELATEDCAVAVRRATGNYPVLRQEHMFGLVVGAEGVMTAPEPASPVWRLASTDNSTTMSLSADFVALETTAYAGRSAFLDEWRNVLLGVSGALEFAPQVLRVGVRYVNQLGPERLDLVQQLRSEIASTSTADVTGGVLVDSMTQLNFSVGPGTLAVRWATVPGGVLVDPAVPVLPALSWVLDLDASQSPGGEFTVDAVADATRWGAETAYTFFRWAMTDYALEMLG